MNRGKDIDHVREYCSVQNIAFQDVTSPKQIHGLYDTFLSRLPRGLAAKRFMNYGYWEDGITDSQRASENLIKLLVSRMPNRSGRLLDVACGTGVSTRHLAKYWGPERVVGINISERQISVCLHASSACRNFAVVDAARMAFSADSFENIVCIEAAFHFNTREAFVKDCHRILKANGTLALTDILLHEKGHDLLPLWLPTNFIASLSEYEDLLRRAGFSQVDVCDITEQGWLSFARRTLADIHEAWLSGRCSFSTLRDNVSWMYRLIASHKFNVICFATK